MDFLYEMIFLGLLNTAQSNKIPKGLRYTIAIFISIIFISIFVLIGMYVLFAVDQSIANRLLFAFFEVIIALYYIHLLKGMKKS